MATNPTTPVSPKVKAGANWAILATLALTVLSSVTPEMLDFLGNWAPLAYGGVVGATYALGAYMKRDDLRDYGALAMNADNAAAMAATGTPVAAPTTPTPSPIAQAPRHLAG